MPTISTSYPENMRSAVEGMIADMTAKLLVSRNVEPAGGIGFGKAVAQGVADKGIILPTGAAVSIGLTVRERSLDANNPNIFPQYASARVMLKGAIWAVASVAVVAGDPVYVVPTTGVLQKTNGSSAIQIPNARWETTQATPGGLAVVRLL